MSFVATEKTLKKLKSCVWIKCIKRSKKYEYGCSCGSIEYGFFPCVHVILCADLLGLSAEYLVPGCYHTSQLKNQFPLDMNFPDIDSNAIKRLGANKNIMEPVMKARKPGRPKTEREKSSSETNKDSVYLCSICRKTGHKSTTCPDVVGNYASN